MKDEFKNVTVFTSTRADYGIFSPLIHKLEIQSWCNLTLIVSGTHLMEQFGNTKKDIGLDERKCVEIDLGQIGDGVKDVSNSLASSIIKCSDYFNSNKADLLIVLGDRFEALGCTIAAVLNNTPIAHLHGGELTEGAIDDSFRHCITKMSSLHFASTEVYRKRIIQMGESPETVFNFGALAVENIQKLTLMNRKELSADLEFDLFKPYFLVTYHPETVGAIDAKESILEFLAALDDFSEFNLVITYPNIDSNHNKIIKELINFRETKKERVFLTESLGLIRYLSVMKYSSCVIGNSSSGIIEAPVFSVPTVNVGNRQKGRLQTESIVNSQRDKSSIIKAIKKAIEFSGENIEHPYGTGETSELIINTIKKKLPEIKMSKSFYDINFK